ncbi:MAG: pyrimidine reductase family protein [Acidimicrobiales bacterium]
MQQLFPQPVDDVNPLEVYSADDRPAPNNRPWLMMNMIATLDGGVSIDGVSGGLGGPGDKAVFSAIRGVADVILVASGTVKAENYRPPQASEQVQEARAARGQDPHPQLAIVSGSLGIDPDHQVFGNPDARAIVITHEASPQERRAALADKAEVLVAGEQSVDLAAALGELASRGAGVVLAEGGPTLNGALVAQDLVDELCLSMSPMLVGGNSPRIVHGNTPATPRPMTLERVLIDGDFTFHRYVRATGTLSR